MNTKKGIIHNGFLIAASMIVLLLAACGPVQTPTPDVLVVTSTPEPSPVVMVVTATQPPEEPPAEEPAADEPAAEEPAAEQPAEEATAEPAPTEVVSDSPLPGVASNSEWTPEYQTFEGIEYALVPPGCFEMGSNDAAGTLSEQPVHKQCFDRPFWIAVYEVTNALIESSSIEPEAQRQFRGDEVPRTNVTWFEAAAFCESVGGRLPTEREWEYAARGPDGLRWPFGDQWLPGFVIHAANATSPVDVGTYPENASWVGALDMVGNVREWTSTGQASYPYDPTDGREDTSDRGNAQRITRGGGFLSGKDFVRSAYREWYDRAFYTADIGLRCARDY